MRVLHVTDTYLPRVGGIELHVSDLAARQQLNGHQVAVLTAERQRTAAPSPVPVRQLRSGIAGVGIAESIRQAILEFAPDLVHAHLSVGSPFGWAALRHTPVPALATIHSLLPSSPLLVRAGIRATRIPLEQVTLSAVSEVAAAPLRAALGRTSTVHVLHNGIDPEQWRIPHNPTGCFNIVAVGRLAARKRPLVLIDALSQLHQRFPDLPWTAHLVGDGPQRHAVTAAIRSSGLDERVHLAGTRSRAEVRHYLSRADVFVAPATLESFGIAALEARCAGVPILGMAHSGVAEYVRDGHEGLLASTDADLVGCLLQLAMSPTLVHRIRHHNSRMPVSMDWESVVTDHDSLYQSALAPDRARQGRRLTADQLCPRPVQRPVAASVDSTESPAGSGVRCTTAAY